MSDKEHDKGPKKFHLVINGKKKEWLEETISYKQVVELAFPGSHNPDTIFTVQYSHGPKENPRGTLVEGQSVQVKNEMRFDVTPTDKS